jgi:glycosyltransferase involved in cell wall biosynthesis
VDESAFETIDRPYLQVIPIPCYVDDEGVVWLDKLWHHDLVEHLSYLRDFVLCAPRLPWEPGLDLVRLENPPGARVSFVFLPPQGSYLGALRALPRTVATIWGAIARADIVASGIIGWPYPLGWIANPIAWCLRKRLFLFVESPWRIGRTGWKHRLVDLDFLRDWMGRWSCRRAHLAIFTQEGYRDALCATHRGNAHVAPAVWVNDADVLSDRDADAAWDAKEREPARFLLAGRLVSSKGVDVLLEALRLLDARGSRVAVDVIGQGDRRDACVGAAAELRSVRLRVLDPVPYGRPFFELVRRYQAVLIPNLSDEQPRIVFDAYAQGVPVIAADTAGLRPYVDHGATGWLLPAGDVAALASALERAVGEATVLRAMGLAALRSSRGMTHKAMHRQRARLLHALFA